MVMDGSACVTFRVYVAGGGMTPKLLLAALSVQSPEKLGLSVARAAAARATMMRTAFESDFMGVSWGCYSYLSATPGSACVARRAGIQHATSATAVSSNATMT